MEEFMSTLVEELSQKALSLPAGERVRLAEALLATLQPADTDTDAAWDAEITRRIAEVDAGEAILTPADEVFAELRRMTK